jgi:hypothetical protein
VSVIEDTDYPFRDRIRLTVNPAKNAPFPLELRIPQWTTAAHISVNGQPERSAGPGSFHRIDREWRAGDVVEITLPMKLRVSRWYQNSVALERGPLVYSLRIGEDWKKLRDRSPAADWEVFPTTPWNYGLLLDPDRPEASIQVQEKRVGDYPFSAEGAPVELMAKGRRIPEWKLINGSAAAPPQSPVSSAEAVEPLTLIPYGAAKLRITAFPLLEK